MFTAPATSHASHCRISVDQEKQGVAGQSSLTIVPTPVPSAMRAYFGLCNNG
jgi:hypothetical protein